jgi:hypothetical protein
MSKLARVLLACVLLGAAPVMAQEGSGGVRSRLRNASRCAGAGRGFASSRPNRKTREAYRKFLELPPERRDALHNRWEQMSPAERRRAIQRRQGPKPDTIDKRPCPPC